MKRLVSILLLIAGLLTASCGFKIDMPTLGSGYRGAATAAAGDFSR